MSTQPQVTTPINTTNDIPITLLGAVEWINDPNNKTKEFFVRFIKKTNNELREMRCATGIADKNILVGNPYNPGTDFKKKGLINVYELDKQQYRSFDPNTLVAVKLGKEAEWQTVIK